MITGNSILKIIIVHESLIGGIACVAVLRRLAAQLEAELAIKGGAWQIDSNVWKFEMVRNPELCAQATAEAAEADMIIISVGGDGLPADVSDWLERVLPMKDGRPAALVALMERGNDISGEPLHPETSLRQLAEQHGLDFFCNTGGQSRHIASGIESVVSRYESDSTIWRESSRELLSSGMGPQRTYLGQYAN